MSFELNKDGITLEQERLHFMVGSRSPFKANKRGRVMTIEHFKGGHTGSCMERCIIVVFGPS